MKLTIARDTLLSAVRQCVLQRGSLGNPNLGLVSLTATKVLKRDAPDQLALRASIGLVAINIVVAAKLEEEGDIAVDAKALRDTVAGMPSGDLTLTLKKDKLTVAHGPRRWTGQTQPANLVGVLPVPGTAARSLICPAREILTMIDRVKFAVPNVPNDRLGRMGIFLDVADGVPSTVVWGAHMNVYYTPVPAPELRTGESKWSLLLTPLVIDRLRELALEKDAPELELLYELTPTGTPMFAWLRNASTDVCFAPPVEPYPDWRALVARADYSPVCRVPRLALLQSLAALIAAADEYAAARVTLALAEAALVVEHQAGTRKAGAEGSTVHFEDRIPVTDVTTASTPSFFVNAHYFRDALDAAGEDAVLHLDHGGQALVLTTERGYTGFVSLTFPP